MGKNYYRTLRFLRLGWSRKWRKLSCGKLDADFYYYMLKEEQRDMARDRYEYFTARRRKMNILRNIFCTFVVAVAIVVLMSVQGCALLAATHAFTDDKVDMDGMVLECPTGPQEMERDIDNRRGKDHGRVVCK